MDDLITPAAVRVAVVVLQALILGALGLTYWLIRARFEDAKSDRANLLASITRLWACKIDTTVCDARHAATAQRIARAEERLDHIEQTQAGHTERLAELVAAVKPAAASKEEPES